MDQPSKPVVDFCFTAASIKNVMEKSSDGKASNAFLDVNDYSSEFQNTNLVAVPENFLNVTLDELYVYNELQSNVDYERTSIGQKDAISLLYNEDEVDQYVTYPSKNQNGYNIISNDGSDDMQGPTWTLKMLIAGIYSSVYSVDVGDILMSELKFGN